MDRKHILYSERDLIIDGVIFVACMVIIGVIAVLVA
jgi:hypothetical protein